MVMAEKLAISIAIFSPLFSVFILFLPSYFISLGYEDDIKNLNSDISLLTFSIGSQYTARIISFYVLSCLTWILLVVTIIEYSKSIYPLFAKYILDDNNNNNENINIYWLQESMDKRSKNMV
eukprot:snap_masked-scaffold_65-processed-gene-0.34-mRNA-1 protein AED:1.00 eAED:1.00 QI:0/0/0/0/1/1/3/0/121